MIEATPSIWQRLCYTPLRDVLRGRLSARLDWRRVVAEAGLPPTACDHIIDVVRRTRLWRNEKADVAAELVAHFQDGLDAGQTPEELINSFGDTRQAARLIRRAKRRGRPLFWHIKRYAGWTIAGVFGVYLLASLYMWFGRPTISVDYFAILNKRAAAVPKNEQAWPLYRDALLRMNFTLASGDDTAWIDATNARPGDSKWKRAEKFLEQNTASLAKIREAATMEELGFAVSNSYASYTDGDRKLFGTSSLPEDLVKQPSTALHDRWLISTLLPHVQTLMLVSPILANDARLGAAKGDGNSALADVVAMLGMSRHVQETPFLVSMLFASRIQLEAFTVVRDVMTDHPGLWTEAQLRDLAHAIAAANVDWRRGYDGETMAFYDIMQRFYTDDGHGDGRLVVQVNDYQNLFEMLWSLNTYGPQADKYAGEPLANNGIAALTLPAMNVLVASRAEMTDMYDRFMNHALRKLDTPLLKLESLPPLDDEQRAIETEFVLKSRYLFINLLLPAYDAVRAAVSTLDGFQDGTLIGIALELYHREHDQWPKTLDELSPRWLPALPVDVITGKPLLYKVAEDRPIVYSVGADKDDDGALLTSELNGEPTEFLAWPANMASSNPVDGDWIIWATTPRDRKGEQREDRESEAPAEPGSEVETPEIPKP